MKHQFRNIVSNRLYKVPLKRFHPAIYHTSKGVVENFVTMMGNDANKLDLEHNEDLIKTTNQKMK